MDCHSPSCSRQWGHGRPSPRDNSAQRRKVMHRRGHRMSYAGGGMASSSPLLLSPCLRRRATFKSCERADLTCTCLGGISALLHREGRRRGRSRVANPGQGAVTAPALCLRWHPRQQSTPSMASMVPLRMTRSKVAFGSSLYRRGTSTGRPIVIRCPLPKRTTLLAPHRVVGRRCRSTLCTLSCCCMVPKTRTGGLCLIPSPCSTGEQGRPHHTLATGRAAVCDRRCTRTM